MNLMEITKGYEPKQSEQQEQTKNSLGTTDRWKPVSYTHLKAAREREEIILKQLEEKDPLPDKEKDQMAWVRAANPVSYTHLT